MKMETGRNVPQKKNRTKIVQDLPSNTGDLESGRKPADATSQRLTYQQSTCNIFQLARRQRAIAQPRDRPL